MSVRSGESGLGSESTNKIWYLADGGKALGPYTFLDIQQLLLKKEISWVHFVWKNTWKDWVRICDTTEFQVVPAPLQPESPPPTPLREEATKPAVTKETREWFCYENQTQTGPYTLSELRLFLTPFGELSHVYVWRQGLKEWVSVGDVPEFSDLRKDTPKNVSSQKARERRASHRVPVIAKVRIVEAPDSIERARYSVALARDLSVGGMQVLTEHIPRDVGAQLKVIISPAEDKDSTFTPFQAQGLVVRFLEDGRGFSFRFEKLDAQTISRIQKLVEAGA